MSQHDRPGYYLDAQGVWQTDRRTGKDRRGPRPTAPHNERRELFRRKIDREAYVDDARAIEDALVEFAAQHGGHV